MLPECTWPADKAAPAGLDVIRRFCNTCNIENGADRFETVDGLQRWLDDQGLGGAAAAETDRRRLVAVREQLRAHALAHHAAPDEPTSAVPLDAPLVDVPVTLAVEDGRLTVLPAGRDVASRTIGVLALAVMESQRADVWRRFKACPSCGWVFFDRSKNRSGRWCSMSACGGRAKVAAFRERREEGAR